MSGARGAGSRAAGSSSAGAAAAAGASTTVSGATAAPTLLFSVSSFNAHVENTMRAPVFISARQSELSIIAKYNIKLAESREKIEQQSSQVLITLVNKIRREANRILREDQLLEEFLGDDDSTQFVLTQEARNIILYNNDSSMDQTLEPTELILVKQARHAYDVIAALQELNTGTCHMLRYNMERTRLPYGLRDVTAILWAAVIRANRTNNFMPGVTFNDALNALIHGIANAARGANRDVIGAPNMFDNLGEPDPKCDQGCYNDLLQSMVGILPEVVIIYSYMDAFHAYLQNAICEVLAQSVFDPVVGHECLDIWLGNINPPIKPPQHAYFLQQVTAKFPEMISSFADSTAENNPASAQLIIEYLNSEILRTEASVAGMRFIESVSPHHSTLQQMYDRKSGELEKRAKYAPAGQ